MIASAQRNNTNAFHQREARLRKARSLGIKCVPLLDIDFDGLSLSASVMKHVYNFPKKYELPTFILPVKISWLFLRVSGLEMKNLPRSEQAHFLAWRLRRSISCSRLRCARLRLNSLLCHRLVKMRLEKFPTLVPTRNVMLQHLLLYYLSGRQAKTEVKFPAFSSQECGCGRL